MLPLNPSLGRLPVYHPGRPIEDVARELGLPAAEIIKLASNENPLGPSPAALIAMEQTLQSLHLYPDGNAFYLKQRLAEKLGLAPSQLLLGNGSNELIEFVGHALLAPGTEVVVSEFCFAVYPIVTHLFGARLVTVPAREHGHDLAGMLRAVTPLTRVVFVANPNNPTGTVVSPDALRQFIRELPPQVLLVLDEAYIEFVDAPCDLLPDVRAGHLANVMLLRTFSKIYGLAGLRLGYGIGHPELIGALEKVRQPFNVNALAQAGALAALDDAEHIARTRKNNREGLSFFEAACRELNLRFIPPAANFILVHVGDGQRVFAELQQLGVIVRPMAGYQLPEWIRISIGTPTENARCLSALKKALGYSR